MKTIVVKEKRALEQFVSLLPALPKDNVYYFSLMARNKYSDEMDINDSLMLGRNYAKTKSDLVTKICKLEVEYGLYDFKGTPIPNQMLVAYMKPNPRNIRLGSLMAQRDMITEQIKSFQDPKYSMIDPNKITMNALQNAHTIKNVLDVDIDIKDESKFGLSELMEMLIDHVGISYVRSIVKTRGGYHVQILTNVMPEAIKKRWVMGIKKVENEFDGAFVMELVTDGFLPIPGTTQGGFTPTMIFYQNQGVVLATSYFWSILNIEKTILDPDGWDRKDYTWSYHYELITSMEYMNRTLPSTVMVKKIDNDDPKLVLCKKISAAIGKISDNSTMTNTKKDEMISILGESHYNGEFNDYINFLNTL